MKVAIINTLSVGSTGNIAKQIRAIINSQGDIAEVFTGNWGETYKTIRFGYKCENIISGIFSKITGFHHIYSIFGTFSLIKKLEDFSPDIIHLHNLHLWVINVPMLMCYLKKKNIKVVWTLHDCWSFTGRCPHFLITDCNKWQEGCGKCPYSKRGYPQTLLFDQSSFMWNAKKKWFSQINDLVIVTPSEWLANLVKKSFLKDYPIKIINNGVDLNLFTLMKSNFKEKYNINNKKIILGVAFDWGYSKGLDVFCDLARESKDEYVIVLVGTNEEIDKVIPQNIISIHRTSNQKELAEIYNSADVFLNPTREDTFPTVNMEALACGTPVVTFKTGGSPEIIDQFTGIILENKNISEVINAINKCCNSNIYSRDLCRKRAEMLFDKNERFMDYYKLYKELMKN